jgi:aspartyl/asparaginyl beta-hydroxylase (cupin superfamily)
MLNQLFGDFLGSGVLFSQDFDVWCRFHLKLNVPKVLLISEQDANRHAGFNAA